MSKIAAFADLHFRDKNLADIHLAWESALEICVDRKVRSVLIAGDVFDSYNVAGRAASFGTVFSAFADPLRMGLPGETIIIPGNHDIAGPGQKDALVPLDGYKGIRVAHVPQVIQGPDVAIACLPWLTKAHLASKEECKGLAPDVLETLYRQKVADVISYLKAELDKAHGYKILLGHCDQAGAEVQKDFYMVGGSFEPDSALLERVGADRIVLGHVHKKQGWYIGALTQLNFGEEDNATGFEILDTETGDVEMIHVDSPRYFTVKAEEYKPENFKATDYVKVRGKEPPVVGDDLLSAGKLPENVQFEKIPESTTMTRRLSENMDPSADPGALLEVWSRETACEIPVPELAAELEQHVTARAQGARSAIGSLKKIRSIKLVNIGSHTGTDVALPDGITAITGHNGAGKTFLLESPMAILYGTFPSRPKTVPDYVPAIGDALLEMEFDSNGSTYRARREVHLTAKTRQQTGYLFEGEKTIAGGPAKMEEYEAACRDLVGDADLVLASIFSSQNQAGDLVTMRPADRKELFHKLLGLERFGNIAQSARDAGNAVKGRIAQIEEAIMRAQEELGRKGALQARLMAIGKDFEAKEDELAVLEKVYRGIVAEKEKAAIQESRRRDLEAEKEAAGKALREVSTQLERLTREKEEIEAALKKAGNVEESLSELAMIRERYDELQQAASLRMRAESAISKAEGAIATEKQRLEYERARLVEKNGELKAQVKILGEGDFKAEQCQTCRFLAGARNAAGEIEKNQARIDQIEVMLLEEAYCLDDRKKLAELKAALPKPVDEKEIVRLRARITELEPAQRIAGKVEEQKKSVERLTVMCEEARGKKIEASKKWEAVKDKTVPESNLAEIETRERQADAAVRAVRADISGLTEERGRISAEIERLLELDKKTAAQVTEVGAGRREVTVNETLARAFGRDGIPQLLIDNAIPQIQDILNDLLSALQGRFSVQFSTQKALKSGTIQETIDIVVSDGAGSRDISDFSGGEQKLMRMILRLSLAIFQSQRAGKRLEVFFVDEAFDALDRDNAVRLLNILGKLQERFQQVFVVSHTDDLISDLPNIIRLEKTNGGTVVAQ